MNIEALRILNFRDLISLGIQNVSSYSFEEYRKNGYEHAPINGYCLSCEEQGFNTAKGDINYKLTNISHGSHSTDFFLALKRHQDTSNWHQEPILFVYETPSLDYGIYKEVPFKGFNKRPAKDWYWIHDDLDLVSYPDRFCGGEYGGFVLSAIQTFRLANVYMTNLVKCGLNNDKKEFKGLAFYQDKCIKNCYDSFLRKEIDIIKPEIIFAVGTAVEDWVKLFVNDLYYVQQLPHPAGRRRGFRDEHFKAIYFWVTVKALHARGIIQQEEVCKLANLYLEHYDRGRDV